MTYEQLQMDGLPSTESASTRSRSYPQASRVSLTALREKVRAIVTSVTCGEKSRAFSESCARGGSSVKIRPVCSQERISGIFGESYPTLPRWGIQWGGEYGELVTSERRTSVTEYFLWRTPTASDGEFSGRTDEKLAERWENQKQKHLSEQVAYIEMHGGGVFYLGDVRDAHGERRKADEFDKQYVGGALYEEGRENEPCGANRGADAISDADGVREQQPCGEQQESGKRACDVREIISDARSEREDERWIGSAREVERNGYGGDDHGRRAAKYVGGEWWEVEPDVGRVAHGVSDRVDKLRCLGNAVVPYQAYPIFEAIAEFEMTVTQ